MDSLDRFKTPRLVAERLQEEHLDDLLGMDQDPRIMNTLGGARTEERTREYLQRNLDHWDEHGYGLWMLKLRSDGSFVGRAALRQLPIEGSNESVIGYALMPKYWGIGLATEIAAAIVDLAFSRLGLDDLVVGARPENRASLRVMEKIGARYDRDAFYKESPHVVYRIRRFDRLETPRLVADRLRESHLDNLQLMGRNPDVMRTLGGLWTDQEAREHLDANLKHWDEHGFGLWIMTHKTDGSFVGRAALRHVHVGGNNEIEVGYALMPEYWGIGLATEIASAIVETAFSGLGLQDLVAFALPDNLGSRRVIEKLGGTFERDITYKGLPHVLYRIFSPIN